MAFAYRLTLRFAKKYFLDREHKKLLQLCLMSKEFESYLADKLKIVKKLEHKNGWKKRYVRSFTRNLQDNNVIEWEGAMDHALGGGSRGEGEEIVWDPSTGALPWRIDRLARRGVVSGISCALFLSISLSLHTLYICCMWTDWQEIE